MKTKIEFKNNFPSVKSFNGPCLLIYDLYFENSHDESMKHMKDWIKTFQYRIGFQSGEELKNLASFPEKIEKILSLVSQIAMKDVQIIGLGGGSIGDFTGFVASILKRGLPLVHIPTTWLSAMDSAHGGKTALNVTGFKNQIGTFYAAQKIILIKPVLLLQPQIRAEEAFGEAIKIALLTGKELWTSFSKMKSFDNSVAWKFLPKLIDGKYKIVNKDPFEKKGIRHLLNLGHTFGHVWEASNNLPHGKAVAFGIRAAIEFSKETKILNLKKYNDLNKTMAIQLLPTKSQLVQMMKNTPINIQPYLIKDKKISKKNTLRFIFVQSPGKCPIKDVSIVDIQKFYNKLQGQN
jgi:3-dehydroquinate synthase